jgi:2-polyprenyl-6-methoxyphenol hydroxylase-like FAD-dependent oxidoreductase
MRVKSRLVTQLGEQAFPHLPNSAFRELLLQRAPWFEGSLDPVHWSIEVRFARRVAEQFGYGRVWLAGDAAHATGPLAVHSMNIGLQEASEVGRACAFILRAGASMQDLSGYGQAARSRWLAIESEAERITYRDSVPTWVRCNGGRIAGALPASGAVLGQLLTQIGLEHHFPTAPARVQQAG